MGAERRRVAGGTELYRGEGRRARPNRTACKEGAEAPSRRAAAVTGHCRGGRRGRAGVAVWPAAAAAGRRLQLQRAAGARAPIPPAHPRRFQQTRAPGVAHAVPPLHPRIVRGGGGTVVHGART